MSRYRRFCRTWAKVEIDHGRAFLFAPVCLGLGAAFWFSWPRDPPLAAIAAACLILAVVAFAVRYRPPVLRYGAVAMALVLAGMLLAQIEAARRATVILDSAVTTVVSGEVARREIDGQGHWRYMVLVRTTADPQLRRPPHYVSLLARSAHAPIDIGAGITGRARLSPPSGPALPQLNDFAFAAYFDGVGAVGYYYGAPKPTSLAGDNPGEWSVRSLSSAIDRRLFRLRAAIGDRIRAVLPGDTGAFAAAIVTDERRAISKETTEALRLSGLAHIIAISGLNMALAAGIFFVGLRAVLSLFTGFAQAYPVKKIAAGAALAATGAYYLISGFAVSAERAFLMMAIMLIAVLFDRPSISLRNVALSAIVILAISPSEIMGPSFQMSFAATLALVAGYAIWKERPGQDGGLAAIPILKPVFVMVRFFGGIFLTSLIGGASTAIFSIEHFHRLATYGLPANLAAMPIISFIVMPAGLMAMLLMPFGLDSLPLKLMGLGLDLVIAIGKAVAGWGGQIDFGRLHPWFFPGTVAGMLLMMLLKTHLRHAGTVLIGLSGLVAVFAGDNGKPDLIIAEDGRLVALIAGEGLNSNRARPTEFIFSQWQRALRLPVHRGPRMLADKGGNSSKAKDRPRRKLSAGEIDAARTAMKTAMTQGEERQFSCVRKAWCVARIRTGLTLVVVDDPAFTGAACDTASIVVVSARLRFDTCRSGATLITGESLRRSGALEIRFPEDKAPPAIVSALGGVDRPWTLHRSYDWRSGTFQPRPPAMGLAPVNDSGE